MIEPTIKEIVRFHELNEKLCFEDNLTKEEQDEINSLEKIIMPFNCIAIMNDEIEKLRAELKKAIETIEYYGYEYYENGEKVSISKEKFISKP